MSKPLFLLASTSAYRRELAARLHLPFEVANPQVDETAIPGESPPQRAQRLSLAKARAVAQRHRHALVVGSDQVAALGERILHKPRDAESCRRQLAALAGHTASFYTGCALVHPHGTQTYLDTTSVVFRTLTPEEIERYVAAEQPFDCAGGFKAEGLGIALFERIDSADPSALIGLPLIWLAGALRAAGLQVP